MKFLPVLLICILLSFVACNGKGGSSSSDPKVSSGDISSAQVANSYIQESKKQIPVSLQVKVDDLESLKQDGLATQEEVLELAQIFKE